MTGKDLKIIAAEWLQKQGVAVVLLIGFIAYLHYGVTRIVPEHIRQINDGFDRRHDKLIESFDAKHSDDRELILRLMEANDLIQPREAQAIRGR